MVNDKSNEEIRAKRDREIEKEISGIQKLEFTINTQQGEMDLIKRMFSMKRL